jgi:GT2 family glycosyltransferase
MSNFLPWKIMNVSVRDLPDLPALSEYGGLFMVFWCGDAPVGQMSIPASLLPIPSSQLAAVVPSAIAKAVGNRVFPDVFQAPLPVRRWRHSPPELPKLTRLLEMERPLERSALDSATTTPLSVALVICTKNRPKALEKCLFAIGSLLPRPDEIIIVDNDPSTGATLAVASSFPGVRYVPEPRPGLSVARNTGIRHCTSDLVAFTDDDVIVHSAWIGAVRRAFLGPQVAAMTGLVLPAELKSWAQFAFQVAGLGWSWGYRVVDFDEQFFNSMKDVGVPVWRIGAGANMAFRREVFTRVGLFDERLGAGAAGCSEDSELWYRLLAEGYRCRYEPSAVVYHAHRLDREGLSEQTYSYMRGHVAALLFQFDRYRHWGNLYRAFLELPYFFMTLVVRSLKKRVGKLIGVSGGEIYTLPLGLQIRGAIAGCTYFLKNRRVPANSGPK